MIARPGMPALWKLGGFVTFCVWCVSGVTLEDLGQGEWSAPALVLCLWIKPLFWSPHAPSVLVSFQSCPKAAARLACNAGREGKELPLGGLF